MTDLVVSFDGGGGGMNDKPFACAIVAFFDDNRTYEESKPLGWGLTNNIAEYVGLLLALDFAGRLDTENLSLRSDSMLVVEQVLGNWRVKNPVLQELHKQATEAAKSFRSVQIKHVPRKQNRRADKLCNTEIDRQIINRNLRRTGAPEAVIQAGSPASKLSFTL